VIDWLKLRFLISAEGKIPGDMVCIFDPDGQLKWRKVKALPIVGSHEAAVHVSSCPVNGCLVIDGNPAKFFQGHNVFGSENIHGLATAITWHVQQRLELELTEVQRQSIYDEMIEVHRVDINRSYSVGSLANARAAVRAIGERATMRHRGRGQLTRDGTAYFGKHSRRSSIKVYAKGHELTEHALPKDFPFRDEIEAFAQDKLRVELVLRTMEAKDLGLNVLCNWRKNTVSSIFDEFMGKLNVPDNIEPPLPTLESLSPRLRLAYSAWMRGDDLRATLPARTFYRYRKAMLDHGVDILTVRPSDPSSNVTPMLRFLELKPASVPEWAYGTSVFFDPQRAAA